ncbi:MAG: site-2 protease family protein [Solirubrobacteraceae bacterium]|jgi:Zn-dependent protease
MFGRSSIQLARLFGIRIGVDTSWFVVLFFFIFLLSGSFRATLNSSDTVAYLTAVASALLFFVSLVLHELGHALVARRLGIGISGIDLWFFGGLAKMERDPDSPGTEFKIAVAGPLVTLAVVAVCVAIGSALTGWDQFQAVARLRGGAAPSPGLLLLGWLATINTVLFAFNLVPGFPLDGGRIARAAAWRITGDRARATRIAATLGQIFAYLLIVWGLLLVVVGRALVSGLWAMALGWLLLQAARGELMRSAFSERMGGITVADIMDRDPVTIPSSLPLPRALEEFFLRYRWPWFPVVDPYGRFVGVVREERVRAADAAGDAVGTVAEMTDGTDAGQWRVGQDASLESLLASEPLHRLGALMAVDGDGILRGVVTRDQVRRALQSAAARQA